MALPGLWKFLGMDRGKIEPAHSVSRLMNFSELAKRKCKQKCLSSMIVNENPQRRYYSAFKGFVFATFSTSFFNKLWYHQDIYMPQIPCRNREGKK